MTKGLNKITQNETQDLQLVDNFCKSWGVYVDYGCSQFAIDIEGNSLVEMVKKVVAQL